MSQIKSILPLFTSGKVVKGFGRGSKELGIPTANIQEEVVEGLPDSFRTGIYYGLASIDGGIVHKMVMSVGWNPFYNNEKKSIEAHLLHEFEEDFYGSILKSIVIGYIRPEQNFSSIDELIKAIKNDIKISEEKLSTKECQDLYWKHPFWNYTVNSGVFSYNSETFNKHINGVNKLK